MNEEWRDIPGWEGLYQASSLGRIRSLPRESDAVCGGIVKHFRFSGRVLSQFSMTSGYLMVTLSRDGIKKNVSVHRSVCSAFHGKCPPEREVAHGDGNKLNNKASNLRWATKLENAADRVAHAALARDAKANDNAVWESEKMPAHSMLGGR